MSEYSFNAPPEEDSDRFRSRVRLAGDAGKPEPQDYARGMTNLATSLGGQGGATRYQGGRQVVCRQGPTCARADSYGLGSSSSCSSSSSINSTGSNSGPSLINPPSTGQTPWAAPAVVGAARHAYPRRVPAPSHSPQRTVPATTSPTGVRPSTVLAPGIASGGACGVRTPPCGWGCTGGASSSSGIAMIQATPIRAASAYGSHAAVDSTLQNTEASTATLASPCSALTVTPSTKPSTPCSHTSAEAAAALQLRWARAEVSLLRCENATFHVERSAGDGVLRTLSHTNVELRAHLSELKAQLASVEEAVASVQGARARYAAAQKAQQQRDDEGAAASEEGQECRTSGSELEEDPLELRDDFTDDFPEHSFRSLQASHDALAEAVPSPAGCWAAEVSLSDELFFSEPKSGRRS